VCLFCCQMSSLTVLSIAESTYPEQRIAGGRDPGYLASPLAGFHGRGVSEVGVCFFCAQGGCRGFAACIDNFRFL
jgi:hypothetical protein